MSYLPALWRATSTGAYTPPSGITRTSTVNSGYLFVLPRPVLAMPVEMTWGGTVEKPKVKHGGNAVRGNYLQSSMVSIQGLFQQTRVGSTDATIGDDSEQMLLWYDLVNFIRPTDTTVKFELFWWYDSGGSVYRKWKNVEKASFVTDPGDGSYNPPRIGYTLQFHLVDPQIYTGSPGV